MFHRELISGHFVFHSASSPKITIRIEALVRRKTRWKLSGRIIDHCYISSKTNSKTKTADSTERALRFSSGLFDKFHPRGYHFARPCSTRMIYRAVKTNMHDLCIHNFENFPQNSQALLTLARQGQLPINYQLILHKLHCTSALERIWMVFNVFLFFFVE